MAASSGAQIVEDGLVFAYDMASMHSWKGKPTTNEFVSGMLNGAYGGDGTLQPGVADPFGTTANPVYLKTSKIRFGNAGGTDEGTLYNGNTYTFSIYLRWAEGYAQQASMEFDIVDRGLERFVNGVSIGTNSIHPYMTYEWQRFSVRALHDNNANYHFIDIGGYLDTGYFEWSCPQIELATNWASPYVPFSTTHQTRSNTESLLDWAGSNTITPTALTYNADNTFDLNGTTDNITTTLPITNTLPYTILMFVEPDTIPTATYRTTTPRKTPLKCNGQWNPGIWVTNTTIRSHATTQYVDDQIDWSDARPTMIGMIFNGSIVYNIFDGELLPRDVVTAYAPGTNNTLIVGGETLTNNSYNWDGKIHAVHIYNRALSAAEVKRNFEALRGRYGL